MKTVVNVNDMVVARDNGHLMCEDCSTYWCGHVEQAVRDNEDAATIWDEYPAPQSLVIPIVPTSNLWANVGLFAPVGLKSRVYKVNLDVTDIASFDVEVYLGAIHPSEGRAVIRSMVIDWFSGTQEEVIGVCTAAGHGYQQTMRWNKDMGQPGTRLIQLWSVWATKKCLGCTFDMANNKDLIPDVGPKASPWDGSKTG